METQTRLLAEVSQHMSKTIWQVMSFLETSGRQCKCGSCVSCNAMHDLERVYTELQAIDMTIYSNMKALERATQQSP
jgi:hypothetical protein